MRRAFVLLCLFSPLTACSSPDGRPLCAGRVPVAEYVVQFGQGLPNLDDEATLNLQADSVSALDVVLAAREAGPETKSAAVSLAAKIAAFVAAMNAQDWIVSQALDDPDVTMAADSLGTEDSLRQANTVEAHVLRECPGVVTVPAPQASFDTLPSPVVPSPTATDPPDAGQKDDSEALALGTLVGNSFGLTLSPAQVLCIGRALRDVVDATQAQSGPGQYSAQYQSAFDGCSVDFTVPAS